MLLLKNLKKYASFQFMWTLPICATIWSFNLELRLLVLRQLQLGLFLSRLKNVTNQPIGNISIVGFFVGYTIQLRLWKQGANWLRSIFFRSIRYRDCQNIQLRRRLPSFWTRSDNMFPVKNINKSFMAHVFVYILLKAGKEQLPVVFVSWCWGWREDIW